MRIKSALLEGGAKRTIEILLPKISNIISMNLLHTHSISLTMKEKVIDGHSRNLEAPLKIMDCNNVSGL